MPVSPRLAGEPIPSRNRLVPEPAPPFQPTDEKGEVGGYAALDEASGLVPPAQLGTGVADATKALLGDQSWGEVATPTAVADALADAEDYTDLQMASHEVAADPHPQYAKEVDLGDLALKDTVATADLNDDAVTYDKLQNVSATDRLLGRSTAGAGNVEEIPLTAAGRALLDDADAAAQRTTLGLSSADIATFLAILLGPLAVAQYTSRTNGGFNLANNASTAWPACEAGIGFLYDTNNSGAALVVWYDGGNAAIIWQNAAIFSTVAGTAGKLNFTYSAGAPTLENKRGATAAIRGFMWRVA